MDGWDVGEGPTWGLSRWLGCCVREKHVAFSVGGVRGKYKQESKLVIHRKLNGSGGRD